MRIWTPDQYKEYLHAERLRRFQKTTAFEEEHAEGKILERRLEFDDGTALNVREVQSGELQDPEKLRRSVMDWNMRSAQQLGNAYTALMNGLATLGDSDEEGYRPIIMKRGKKEVVGKVHKDEVRHLGITDWTEEREAREDTFL